MTISQSLTAPPSPVPDKDNMTVEQFQAAAENYHQWLPKNNTELTAWTTQANSTASTINSAQLAAAQSVINATAQVALAEAQVDLAKAQVALAQSAKTAAETARDLSQAYSESVATLVEGTINDSVVSTTTTFSSSKIKQMIITYTYDDRDNLRSLTPDNNEIAIVDGLGFFVFKAGSDEPDDDESCFATASGKWLLEAVHWDVVDAWQLPDDSVRDEFDEETETDLNTLESKFLYGTATCAITSVSATTSTAFTGTVTGASIGDRVYVNPPAMLGSDAADTSRLSYHAYISATDTVTIQLCNASASSVTVNSAVKTTWKVIVIKE